MCQSLFRSYKKHTCERTTFYRYSTQHSCLKNRARLACSAFFFSPPSVPCPHLRLCEPPQAIIQRMVALPSCPNNVGLHDRTPARSRTFVRCITEVPSAHDKVVTHVRIGILSMRHTHLSRTFLCCYSFRACVLICG